MSEPLTDAQEMTAAQADNAENGAIRLGGRPKSDEPVEMVPLFALNGKTYKVPKKVNMNVGLSILAKMESDGPIFAEMFMLRRLLGQEAYEALLGFDDLEPSDMKAITDKLMELVFSAVEETPGN